MKTLNSIVVLSSLAFFLSVTATAEHGGYFKPNEISPNIDRMSEEIQKYRQSVGNLNDGSVDSLIRGLESLDNSIQNLRGSLWSGFDGCKPRIRQLTRDFSALKQQFSSQLSTHANYKVRLGWYKIEMAYWELEWSLTRGLP